MKILLLSPDQLHRYNWGHQHFRNEIGRQHNVLYYGEGYPDFDKNLTAPQIVDKYGPFDLLLTYGLRYTLPFQNIGDVTIKKAHIVIDLFPSHPGGYRGVMPVYKTFVAQNKYDLFLYRQRCQEEYLNDLAPGTKSKWLPFSVDTNIYKKSKLPKLYDVLTSSSVRNDVYPNRKKVNRLVAKKKLTAVTKRIVHEKYINAINQSKICIISTNIFDSPNMKFTEFTSCGTFVLADKPADMEQLGFQDGKHLVLYSGMDDLKDKINYYLSHDTERESIAKQGIEFTRKNHNHTVRVQEMMFSINKELEI